MTLAKECVHSVLVENGTGYYDYCGEFGVGLIVPKGAVPEKMTLEMTVVLCKMESFNRHLFPVTPIVEISGSTKQPLKPLEIHLPSYVDSKDIRVLVASRSSIKSKSCRFRETLLSFEDIGNGIIKVLIDYNGHPDTTGDLLLCCAIKKEDAKMKRVRMIVAKKRLNKYAMLVDVCFMYDTTYFEKLVKRQYEMLDYDIKQEVFSLADGQKIMSPNFKRGQQGCRMRFLNMHHTYISNEQLDYCEIVREEGSLKLQELLDCWSFPPRYKMKLETTEGECHDTDVAISLDPVRIVVEVQVTTREDKDNPITKSWNGDAYSDQVLLTSSQIIKCN